eukprot:6482720-Prymnesium_polylepis.2
MCAVALSEWNPRRAVCFGGAGGGDLEGRSEGSGGDRPRAPAERSAGRTALTNTSVLSLRDRS